MSGIYIHIPFCRSKCLYCSFYSRCDLSQQSETAFVKALCSEFMSRRGELSDIGTVSTLYFGGGTPSVLSDDALRCICGCIFSVIDKDDILEFTLEVNPDDVTKQRVLSWCELGVNRFSMGVQSLDDALLRCIGRRHSAAGAREAFGWLSELCDNVSVDLILGLPGQSMESFSCTAEEVLSWSPRHFSAYILETDNDSALSRMVSSGRILLPPEQVVCDMYLRLCKLLSGSGYRQYEISNFALPGYESKHNSSYWLGVSYLGFGPGAASFKPGGRRVNLSDFSSYLSGEVKYEREALSVLDRQREFLLTRIRRAEGISLAEYRTLFGREAEERLLTASKGRISEGSLRVVAGSLVLSLPEAGLLSDAILYDIAP